RSERAWGIGLVSLLFWVLYDDLRHMWMRRAYARRLRVPAPRRIAHELARRVDRVVFLERRNELAPRAKALLRSWKKVHIPFSVVLLVTMVLHIVLALKLA